MRRATGSTSSLTILAGEQKPIHQWMPVRLHHAAANVGARIVLLEDRPISPGGNAPVQLVLEHPIAAGEGDRFVVRDTAGQRTIGGGRFLDLRAPQRRRRTPERLAQLGAHGLADAAQSLAARLATAPFLVDLTAFARDRTLAGADIDRVASRLDLVRVPIQGGEFALAPAAHMRLMQSLTAALTNFHAGNPDLPGIGLERLRVEIEPRLPAPVLLAVLQGFARQGVVSFDGPRVRLPAHKAALAPREASLWATSRRSSAAPRGSGRPRWRSSRPRPARTMRPCAASSNPWPAWAR